MPTRTSVHAILRPVLLAHQDGLRVVQIMAITGLRSKEVHAALRAMPDVYIDRWVPGLGAGGWQPVWCAVQVPEDCPKPDARSKAPNDKTIPPLRPEGRG